MDIFPTVSYSDFLDLMVVLGYLGLTLFVMVRVFTTQKK